MRRPRLVDGLHLAVVLALPTLAWAAVAATLHLVVELFRRCPSDGG